MAKVHITNLTKKATELQRAYAAHQQPVTPVIKPKAVGPFAAPKQEGQATAPGRDVRDLPAYVPGDGEVASSIQREGADHSHIKSFGEKT